MFATFQTIINAGGYDLADLSKRIKTLFALGELTEEEMEQLLEQARDNGKHYTCVLDGCVWTPDAYPQGWQLEE